MNVIIYVMAKRDANDNPRRGWIIPSGNVDGTDTFLDEQHTGRLALYGHYGIERNDWAARVELDNMVTEVMLEITVPEYNRLKKSAK